MKTKFLLLISVFFLLDSTQRCPAQDPAKEFSMDAMPAYVKELQQGPPPIEMMSRNPSLYRHLLQRRMVLADMLQREVKQGSLPRAVLSVLNVPASNAPQPSVDNNIQGTTNKTSSTNFKLVKDINTSTNSVPYNYNYTLINNYAVLNKVVYYSADDGIHGRELWRSDGTDTGTYMVKDIATGSATSSPSNITVYKNKLYFSAYNAATGNEVYQSDGTSAGTVVLKDISAGAGSSNSSKFTVMDGNLYFVAYGLNYDCQLWKTNGTTGGTTMVADINTTASAYGMAQLTAVNNLLFFTAFNYAYARELWRSDGTAAGTFMVKDINIYNNNTYYDNGNGPANLTFYNNKLYFSAYDGSQRTLWSSDGTTVGTAIVPYSNGVTLNSVYYSQWSDQPFAIAKNSLFFAGYTYATGNELYKYNALTVDGIVLVKDISAGTINSSITNEGIRSMNDSIYFITPDFTGVNYNLWKSAGTGTTTSIVKAVSGPTSPSYFYSVGKNLYFSITSTDNGTEPWISDGTAPGTKLLKDINTGASSSYPTLFTSCNNKVFFQAYTTANGTELWNSTGTSGSTKLVKDINTTTTADALSASNYHTAIALDSSTILFRATKPETGSEIWKSDGKGANTVLVKDLASGEAESYPQFYVAKKGKVYFSGFDNITGQANNQFGTESIFLTDGTSAGTKKIAITAGIVYDVKVADNGIVFYQLYNMSSYTVELWRTDSSGNNFRLSAFYTNGFTIAGNTCFFAANNGYGSELWRSDGSLQGTYLFADIVPGPGSSYPSYLTPLGNKIVFSAQDAFYNTALWVSDGTTAGTFLLRNISAYLYYGSVVMGGKLYFNAYDGVNGSELYRTDGTIAGTVLIKDIYPGSNGSYPQHFTIVDNTVYFTSNDGVNASPGLWKTTGSQSGTKLVKYITDDANDGGSNLNNFVSAGNKLYFTNFSQLWVSDGTGSGTKQVSDPNLAGTTIGLLVGTGKKLFLSATSYAYGYELYEGDATLSVSKFTANAVAKTISNPGLTAQLGTNPFLNNLKIIINSPNSQQLKISVSNTGGQQLVNKTIDVLAGINFITLDGEQWAHGVYMINIASTTGELNLKAVK